MNGVPGDQSAPQSRDRRQIAMGLSLVAAFLMLGGKLSAYFITLSTAILSDAAESVIHVVATAVAAFSLWLAGKPADTKHPYGHGKIVLFSVGAEGMLIFLAAVFITVEAAEALIFGVELRELGVGIVITGALGALNLVLGLYLLSVGRSENAPVLVANGRHVLTDMWTSVAVVGGVTVVWLTGILWLDPVVALLAAGQIIFTGGRLMRDAVRQAMDFVEPRETGAICTVLDACVADGLVRSYHQLRHRQVNDRRWLEVHLLFPGEMPLQEAHRRATAVEKRVQEIFPREEVFVTSHLEPGAHHIHHPEGHSEDPLGSSEER